MKSIQSLPKTTFGGRRFTRKQLTRVQETVQIFASLSRKELALTVCEHLDWKNPRGALKVESCLKMLEKLERSGVVTLPPKRVTKAPVRRVPAFEVHPDSSPIEGSLGCLTPVSLRMVTGRKDRERWKAYLETYHYLRYKRPFGAHLGYLIVSERQQRELGCLVFSASAAWALGPRDEWIGWAREHREKLLSLILSNDRFLIFPWVKVPHLASHILSVATDQIADDWLRVHGYRPALIETFVDPTRYSGTCYQAANWQYLGKTQGRGRGDRHHKNRETKKDIYVYPLHRDWRRLLTETHREADIKKRYRHDLAGSHKRSVGEGFISLWKNVVDILQEVADEYDKKWQLRKRVINSMILMLLIFRLVSSRNRQSYGTTIDDLWDSCHKLKIPLAQKSSVAASSFCAARKKLDEAIFKCANQRIIEAYGTEVDSYAWLGHRLFAVDGSKINLPRSLVTYGYRTPSDNAHYPQGLLSCLYHVKSRLPFDFSLTSHTNERLSAEEHLKVLRRDDVVVYDRGYLSYVLLHRHCETAIHAVFRLQKNSFGLIDSFFSSSQTDIVADIVPSERTQENIKKQHPALVIVPLTMRLVKYEIAGKTYCLGTTLLDKDRYPLNELRDVYHSRWGIEELYKVSKRLFGIEEFHAKSERGVKQELYAHFVLITMNRLFANRAERELNRQAPATLSPGSTGQDRPPPTTMRIRTNFKHCIHVVQRSLEELLLLENKMKTAVQTAFNSISQQYQKVRPGRRYPRRSLRPDPRWQPSKKNAKRKRKELSTAVAV